MGTAHASSGPRAATGIPGLDDILGGGLPEDRLYLVQGTPGVGKTTLALKFLLEGLARGETALYITLSETEDEVRQVARSHGWSLDGLHLYELSSAEQTLRLDEENTLYATADIELKETMRVLLGEVERLRPRRVVFDSLSEIRLLAQTPMRYRRQLLALKQHFAGQRCTVMLLDDRTGESGDIQVESIAHGVLSLEQQAMDYGADRRRLRVVKLRGAQFRSGHHDFVVRPGGLVVFPRLIALEHRTDFVAEPQPSGIGALDALLGGGLDRGTATLVMGPAGTGKSAIATQFACAAAERGERSTLFLFEERSGTLVARSKALGMNLDRHLAAGRVKLVQIDPAELAPDEFTAHVRDVVEREQCRYIAIDSINGYFNAMPEARFLALQLHELLSFLAERGVATVITLAQDGLVGVMRSPVDVSYLADAVILLRYFEAGGHVRKAISMIKKRSGPHENTIRELTFGANGLGVGEPLTHFHGILTGVPTSDGTAALGAGERVGA
ncbi:MAG: ATPase domain-containing protein [Polyangiales bacterium]